MNTTLIWAAPVSLSVAAAIAALLNFGKIKKTLHSQLRNTPKASCYRNWEQPRHCAPHKLSLRLYDQCTLEQTVFNVSLTTLQKIKAQNEVLIFKRAGRTLLSLFVYVDCLSSNHFTLKNYLSDILCYVHFLELLINLVYLFQHIPYPKTRVTVFKTDNVVSY